MEQSERSRETVGRGTAMDLRQGPWHPPPPFPSWQGRAETEEEGSGQVLMGVGEIPLEPEYLLVSTPKFPAFASGQDVEVFSCGRLRGNNTSRVRGG